MNASEMLDVLHFFFEEDFTYSSEDEMKSQSKSRESIYENLYGKNYKYKYVDPKEKNRRAYIEPSLDDIPVEDELPKPFDPLAKPKSYIPPTEFDQNTGMPLTDVLDAPLSR